MHPKLLSTLSQYDSIILVGWWTGWHIQPIINLLEKGGGIREASDGGLATQDFLWIWWKNSEEEKAAQEHSIPFESITTLKLATTKSPKILLYPFVLIQGILQARKILSMHSALCTMHSLCVFSKWWPGSVAIGIAAWTLWIPLYIHESDTIPGRSSRILGKLATKIFLGFESANRYFSSEKCEFIWQILHPVFYKWKVKSEKWKVLWKTEKKHILVICGSQWSRSVFNTIANTSQELDVEWVIALGKLNQWMHRNFSKFLSIQTYDYLTQADIVSLLAHTDLAITRGSATTLAEIDTFSVKKIIIPLPYSADDHQYWNAKAYEKKWDILLEQKNLGDLKKTIQKLWLNSPHSNI